MSFEQKQLQLWKCHRPDMWEGLNNIWRCVSTQFSCLYNYQQTHSWVVNLNFIESAVWFLLHIVSYICVFEQAVCVCVLRTSWFTCISHIYTWPLDFIEWPLEFRQRVKVTITFQCFLEQFFKIDIFKIFVSTKCLHTPLLTMWSS